MTCQTHSHQSWFSSSIACNDRLFLYITTVFQMHPPTVRTFSCRTLLGVPLLEMPVRPHSVCSDLAQFHAPWKHWLCLPLLRYTYLFMFALCWGINPIIKGICVQRAALRCRVSAVKSTIALRVPSQWTQMRDIISISGKSVLTRMSWDNSLSCRTEMSPIVINQLKHHSSTLKNQFFSSDALWPPIPSNFPQFRTKGAFNDSKEDVILEKVSIF